MEENNVFTPQDIIQEETEQTESEDGDGINPEEKKESGHAG